MLEELEWVLLESDISSDAVTAIQRLNEQKQNGTLSNPTANLLVHFADGHRSGAQMMGSMQSSQPDAMQSIIGSLVCRLQSSHLNAFLYNRLRFGVLTNAGMQV